MKGDVLKYGAYTLTINDIDEVLEKEIAERAEQFGISQAETVKRILHDTLLNNQREEKRKKFARFCGIWTEEDALEFDQAVKDFKSVDPEDWQ
jgi:hypothetical protein